MPKCPNCNLEIDENILYCPMCQAELLEKIEDEKYDIETVQTALLMTAESELQANIVESLLGAYGIPIRRLYKGNDHFGKVIMGLTVNGIDLYVPQSALEEAKSIVDNELIYETEFEADNSDDNAAAEVLNDVYEKRKRSRALLMALLFIPGIIGVIYTIIHYLIKMYI